MIEILMCDRCAGTIEFKEGSILGLAGDKSSLRCDCGGRLVLNQWSEIRAAELLNQAVELRMYDFGDVSRWRS